MWMDLFNESATTNSAVPAGFRRKEDGGGDGGDGVGGSDGGDGSADGNAGNAGDAGNTGAGSGDGSGLSANPTATTTPVTGVETPTTTNTTPTTTATKRSTSSGLDQYARFLKDIGADQYKFAKENYQPLEQQLIGQTKKYLTPEFRDEQATLAGNDVTNAFASKRASNEREMQSMGLGDPSQGRYRSMKRGLDIAEAGTLSSAKTGARRNAEMMGFNALSGLVGRGDQKTAAAVGAYGAAGGLAQNRYSIDLQNEQFGRSLDERTRQFDLDLAYRRDRADSQDDQQESSGFGSMVGTIGGVALAFF